MTTKNEAISVMKKIRQMLKTKRWYFPDSHIGGGPIREVTENGKKFIKYEIWVGYDEE